MIVSRRDFGKLALAALPVAASAAKIDSVVHGIPFGLQSYVFTGIGLPAENLVDVVIKSMVDSGLGECDLYAPLVEPAELWNRIRAGAPATPGTPVSPEVTAARAQAREELTKWRMSAPLDYFRTIRKKFDDAGIDIHAISGFPGNTEEELNRTFDIAEAVGARLVTLTVSLSGAKRVAPLTEKRGFRVGIQGNPNMNIANPDTIAKPAAFEEAVAISKNYGMSFDIGDATGGGYDALDFVKQRLDRISLIYLKDRRKNRTSVPWGEGDTPVAEVLRLVRDSKLPIRCYVDCDYTTTDRRGDVRRSFEFAKAALAKP